MYQIRRRFQRLVCERKRKPSGSHDYLIICLSLILILTGCSSPAPWEGPLATPNPHATVTPTPFGPLESNPILEPIPLHNPDGIWSGFPGPTEASSIEIPPPIPPFQLPKGMVNILVLGSDTRPGFYGSRTDTIMIISLDTASGKARMISIPRDLYIYIPGWKVNRINTADQHGGPEAVALAILYNLGIEIHYWVRVSFTGFITAINILGGLDIDVPQNIVDECDEVPITFSAGMNHMDGYTALCYARVRKSSNDFARMKRQQQVIKATFEKVLSIGGISKVPELYSEFNDLVESNMELGDILPLVPLAATIATDMSQIEGYSLDFTMVTNWRTPGGAAVLLPNREAIQTTLSSIFVP